MCSLEDHQKIIQLLRQGRDILLTWNWGAHACIVSDIDEPRVNMHYSFLSSFQQGNKQLPWSESVCYMLTILCCFMYNFSFRNYFVWLYSHFSKLGSQARCLESLYSKYLAILCGSFLLKYLSCLFKFLYICMDNSFIPICNYTAFKCRPVFLSYTTFYTHISHECPLF